jgi:hypothetical protein
MTTRPNLPIPPPILTIKQRKEKLLFDVSCVDPFNNPHKLGSTTWKDAESLVHMSEFMLKKAMHG